MKFNSRKQLAITVAVGALALIMSLVVLNHLNLTSDPLASTSMPGYDIVLPGQDAPLAGRPAPYGQFIVTHNGVSITTTEKLGTVARTNGYGDLKAIMCDAGAYNVTGNLYGRTTSTGEVYTLTTGLSFPANTNTAITLTQIAPWMSLGLTSEVTGSTTTCGIYVQTP